MGFGLHRTIKRKVKVKGAMPAAGDDAFFRFEALSSPNVFGFRTACALFDFEDDLLPLIQGFIAIHFYG